MIIEDLNMYYSGAWAYDTKNNRPCRIGRITARSKDYQRISDKYAAQFVSFADAMQEKGLNAECHSYIVKGSKGSIEGVIVPTVHLELQWPDMGVVNFDNMAYVISRASRQSVTKGINHHTLRIAPVNQIINDGPWNRPRWRQLDMAAIETYQFIKEIYQPLYYTKDQAINMLMHDKWYGVALSPRISLAFIQNYNRFGVYLYGQLIGSYSVKGNKFEALNNLSNSAKELIYEEVNDLIGASS